MEGGRPAQELRSAKIAELDIESARHARALSAVSSSIFGKPHSRQTDSLDDICTPKVTGDALRDNEQSKIHLYPYSSRHLAYSVTAFASSQHARIHSQERP